MNESDRYDLEGIMYNEDGTFKPLTESYGNTSGELAHYRNTYMEAEREYFEQLLSVESIRNEFIKFTNCGSYALFDEAIRLQTLLETGELETLEELEQMNDMTPEERDAFHMKKLEHAEGLICLYLAAARDKVLMKVLVKTRDGGYGRGR